MRENDSIRDTQQVSWQSEDLNIGVLEPSLNYCTSDPLKICSAEDNYMFHDQGFQHMSSVSDLGKLFIVLH